MGAADDSELIEYVVSEVCGWAVEPGGDLECVGVGSDYWIYVCDCVVEDSVG